MGATVVWDKARRKWLLIDRHPKHHGGRKKTVLGPDASDEAAGREAAAVINRARREHQVAHDLLLGGARPTGAVLLPAWWKEAEPGFADSTRRTNEGYLRLHLLPFFGSLDLAALTREQVKAFAGRAADAGLGQHAVHGALSVLRRALRWAVEQGALDRVPVPNLAKLGREAAAARGARAGTREAWSHAEAAHLLELAEPHLRMLLLCAFHTGARKGELLALTWDRVNFDRGEILWNASRWHDTTKSTKANRARRSAMSDELARVLRAEARERFAEPCEYVFLTKRRKRWDYDGLSTAWRRLRKRAHAARGVRPLQFHSTRHTFVSWALAGGADPLWVANAIGDRVETMLRIYAHFLPGKAQPLDFLTQGPTSRAGARGETARARDASRRRARAAPPQG